MDRHQKKKKNELWRKNGKEPYLIDTTALWGWFNNKEDKLFLIEIADSMNEN